jgi:potassium efflux system protein
MKLRSSASKILGYVAAGFFLLNTATVHAQVANQLDPIAASAELAEIMSQLGADGVEPEFLAAARARTTQIGVEAEACVVVSTEERTRLEARFEPLRNVDADVAPSVFDQRNEILRLLDEATAVQASCAGLQDTSAALVARIVVVQNKLSQQFLSNRATNIIASMRTFPARVRTWPEKIRNANALNLIDGITPVFLFWLLIGCGALAAGIGLLLRHRFNRWFGAAGGDKAEPQMRYLFPRPLAEYSPSLLIGLTFTLVLYATIQNPSLDLAVIRIALGISLYGVGNVIVEWATGPLSPSASVAGLIPNHVKPLRFRLRILIFSLVASFVILGTNWLTIRLMEPEVTGRAAMIFIVAISLLYVFLYLGHIPGLRNRFRLVRLATILALLVGSIAVLIGYQNFAGYIIHGITRTSLALFIIWILLWLIKHAFDYVFDQDSPTAERWRSNLGVSKSGSRTGLGFIQLIADLIIWLSLLVYLIYVWDESGTTLERLVDLVVLGGTVGNIRLVPAQIIGGMLVFAALLVLIGWIKGWVDRRWLQHILMERGAREALITLFGYVAFVIALLIGLTQAGVDLSGLVFVSSALALGIGFGMQEIASNFVSGLILLFERPIRTGDFITVGDIDGFVRKISIRATEIETMDNQNVMVPNSELVSGRVTNWVLRDTYGRLRVVVGVAYGSDVDTVREILERVACEHPDVITDGRAPAPRALFMGFGDSSLDFELRCRINRIDRRFTVTSDINFAIDAAFREARVTIPFPQRDLHIVSYPEQATAGETIAQDEPQTVPTSGHGTLSAVESITRSHTEKASFSAKIGDIWRGLTDIDTIKQWIGGDGQFSPYIGGAYDLSFKDGTRNQGRIDIFMPPRRMRLVEAPRDGEEPLATGPLTVDFRLIEHDGKTNLTVVVAGIPATEEWEEDYNRSIILWQNALVELKDLLSKN